MDEYRKDGCGDTSDSETERDTHETVCLSGHANSAAEISNQTKFLIPRIVVSSPCPAQSSSVEADEQEVREFLQSHHARADEGVAVASGVSRRDAEAEDNRNTKDDEEDEFEIISADDAPELYTLTSAYGDDSLENRCMDGRCLYDPSVQNSNNSSYFRDVVRVPPLRPAFPVSPTRPDEGRNAPSIIPPVTSNPSSTTATPSSSPPNCTNETNLPMIRVLSPHSQQSASDSEENDGEIASDLLAERYQVNYEAMYTDRSDEIQWEDPEGVEEWRISRKFLLEVYAQLLQRVECYERKQAIIEEDYSNIEMRSIVAQSLEMRHVIYCREAEIERLRIENLEFMNYIEGLTMEANRMREDYDKQISALRELELRIHNQGFSRDTGTSRNDVLPTKEQNMMRLVNVEAQNKIAELKLLVYTQQRYILALEKHNYEVNVAENGKAVQEVADDILENIRIANNVGGALMKNLKHPCRAKNESEKWSTMSDVLHCDTETHTPEISPDLQTASRAAFRIEIDEDEDRTRYEGSDMIKHAPTSGETRLELGIDSQYGRNKPVDFSAALSTPYGRGFAAGASPPEPSAEVTKMEIQDLLLRIHHMTCTEEEIDQITVL